MIDLSSNLFTHSKHLVRLGKLKITSREESKVIYILINEIAPSTVSLREKILMGISFTFVSHFSLRLNFINNYFTTITFLYLFSKHGFIFGYIRRMSLTIVFPYKYQFSAYSSSRLDETSRALGSM